MVTISHKIENLENKESKKIWSLYSKLNIKFTRSTWELIRIEKLNKQWNSKLVNGDYPVWVRER